LRRSGRHPLRSLSEDGANQQLDDNPTASSCARKEERLELETAALTRCMGQLLRGLQEREDYLRLKVLELLWVAGWTNRDTAACLGISEQQVANYRFAAVKKLTEQIRDAGLSADVFPELHVSIE
jgi:RNA polymerase sigma-70 factor (ECF subfamily)